jgi:ABC-type Fe3+ transport system permease subunit
MQTPTKQPGKMAKMLGFLGIGLCALCCVLPVIGIIGGAGILTSVAVYAEKLALVLLILSVASFGVGYYRKQQAPSCSIGCDCKTPDDTMDGQPE